MTKQEKKQAKPCTVTGCKGDRDYYVGRTGCCKAHLDTVMTAKMNSGSSSMSVRVSALGQEKGLGEAKVGNPMHDFMCALAGKS